MATEKRDAYGNLIGWDISHTAQQIDDGIDAAYSAEQTANRVTSITSSSTNATYPTAKAVWDLFNSIEDAEEISY